MAERKRRDFSISKEEKEKRNSFMKDMTFPILIPIVGVGVGLYNIYKGEANKGIVQIIVAVIAWFIYSSIFSMIL